MKPDFEEGHLLQKLVSHKNSNVNQNYDCAYESQIKMRFLAEQKMMKMLSLNEE
jgi:hypothetical protein